MKRLLAFALVGSLTALALAQIEITTPSGWTMVTGGGLALESNRFQGVRISFIDTSTNPNLANMSLDKWIAGNCPNVKVVQASQSSTLDGKPFATYYGVDPTGAQVVLNATPGSRGFKLVVYEAPNSQSATQSIDPLAGLTAQWFGLPVQKSWIDRQQNGFAQAGGSTSGGGSVNGFANVQGGGGGSISGTASASATASGSQHSSQQSSQSAHQSSSQSAHDSSSQRDSQSASDSHKQVVYDSQSQSFKMVDSDSQSDSQLSGTYRYSSDLFAAPIGVVINRPCPTSMIAFSRGRFVLSDLGTMTEYAGNAALSGKKLDLRYDNGGSEKEELTILRSANGVIQQFAVGPCVYVRQN